MGQVPVHPNERIGRLCKGLFHLRTGDAARIATFLGPEPWTDEAIVETARNYVEELGERSPRRRTRNMATKVLAAAARAGGREGVEILRVERPGCVTNVLVEQVALDIAMPLSGHALKAMARATLPDADDVLERARDLLPEGRRRARRALADEMGAFGADETDGWADGAAAFSRGLDAFLAQQASGWDAAAFVRLLGESLADALADPLPRGCGAAGLVSRLEAARDAALREHSERRNRTRARAPAGLDRYAALFPAARGLGRKLVLIVGPTNSGKTHEALALAAAAPTAAVLSPLRLLALEHFERLGAAGVAAGMVTGEEILGDPEAGHVACTVEAASLSRVVDVGVVDEVQMLASPHRGWAWTQALAGLPARTLVMTGSPDAVGPVEALARVTGEPLEVRVMERKAPLAVLPSPVPVSGVAPGDAVVAFSRRAAMALREALQLRGHEVAMVYGNLSPEVRRAEAARFRSGAAPVVVATDAIGMGLNLPVRRVLFSALEKFDGRTIRPLTDAEIRQVAGRAGRFAGPAEGAGACGVLEGADPARLRAALSAHPSPSLAGPLFVRPTGAAVAACAEESGATSLAAVLRRLSADLVEGRGDLAPADLTDELALAAVVDRTDLGMREKFAYACLPLSPRDHGTGDLVAEWASRHAAGQPCRRPRVRPDGLFEAEIHAQRLTAYLWMARRYPEAYREAEAARADRAATERLIESLLRANPWRGRALASLPAA